MSKKKNTRRGAGQTTNARANGTPVDSGANMQVLVELVNALKKKYTLSRFQQEIAFAQMFHESVGLNYEKAIQEKNVAGIKYVTGMRNAVASKIYIAEDGVPYAKFENWADFWNIFLNGAHLYDQIKENNEGAPIFATTVKDYVHRLKLNGYFTGIEEKYIGGVVRYHRESKELLDYLDSKANEAIAEHKLEPPKSTGDILSDLLDAVMQIPAQQPKIPWSGVEDIYMPPSSLQIPSLQDLPIGASKISEINARSNPAGIGNIYKFTIKKRRVNGDIVTDIHEMKDPQPHIESPKSAKSAVKNKPASRKGSLSDNIPWSLRPRPYQYQKREFFRLDSFSNRFSLPIGAPKSEHIEGTKRRGRRSDTAYMTPTTSAANDLLGVTSNSEGDNPDFFMRSFLKPQTDLATSIGADGDTRRIVSVNINTPLIGSLTIAATGMGETLYNIQQQVEKTLLEVVDNLNTA